MKKILVTGAKGMLGHDLCPTLEDAGYETIETDIDNLDITDFDLVQKFLKEAKPDAVVHCAAYTNVDKAETEGKDLAMKINVTGTENLAKTCAEFDIPIVYTGLRPGENMFEECLKEEEGLQKTANDLIFVGKPIAFDKNLFFEHLISLKKMAYEDDPQMKNVVEKLVPSYQAEKNSD